MATATVRDVVVVDTNVVSHLWRRTYQEVVEYYEESLVGTRLLISFMTEKELGGYVGQRLVGGETRELEG